MRRPAANEQAKGKSKNAEAAAATERQAAQRKKTLDRVAALSESDAKSLLANLLSPETLFVNDGDGETLLSRAISANDAKLTEFLIALDPTLLGKRRGDDTLPLTQAAEEGRFELCAILANAAAMNKEALEKSEIGLDGIIRQPLALAIEEGKMDLIALLHPLWSDPKGKVSGCAWERPLGIASESRQWKAFGHMLANASDAEINWCGDDGETVVHQLLATAGSSKQKDSDRKEAQRAFIAIASRPGWDAENINLPRQMKIGGLSPMLTAIQTGNAEAVRILAPKTDLNAPRAVKGQARWDRGGHEHQEQHTPLSFAIERGQLEIFKRLLSLSIAGMAKKNIHWQGKAEKFTPLGLAMETRAWEFAALLGKELLAAGQMSRNAQRELEEELERRGGDLPKGLKNFKEQFAAAREAAQIRAAMGESSKKSASADEKEGGRQAPRARTVRL